MSGGWPHGLPRAGHFDRAAAPPSGRRQTRRLWTPGRACDARRRRAWAHALALAHVHVGAMGRQQPLPLRVQRCWCTRVQHCCSRFCCLPLGSRCRFPGGLLARSRRVAQVSACSAMSSRANDRPQMGQGTLDLARPGILRDKRGARAAARARNTRPGSPPGPARLCNLLYITRQVRWKHPTPTSSAMARRPRTRPANGLLAGPTEPAGRPWPQVPRAPASYAGRAPGGPVSGARRPPANRYRLSRPCPG